MVSLRRAISERSFADLARSVKNRFMRKQTTFERLALSPDAIPPSERQQSDLHRLFYTNSGTLVHKWRNYLDVYDRHLSRFRDTPFKMLEIGVSEGGSLAMWRKYFGHDATIFGIDIDPRCAKFDGRDGQVRIGSQADPQFLGSVVQEMGGVDVVLDDGSHIASHQRTSFQTLFPLLSEGGVYLCEDLHTSYWGAEFEGGYRKAGAFIEVAKQIIDDIHADFHDRNQTLVGAHRSIHGLHFYNSILAIEKQSQPPPAHIRVGTATL
jgi:hypothetical protein